MNIDIKDMVINPLDASSAHSFTELEMETKKIQEVTLEKINKFIGIYKKKPDVIYLGEYEFDTAVLFSKQFYSETWGGAFEKAKYLYSELPIIQVKEKTHIGIGCILS